MNEINWTNTRKCIKWSFKEESLLQTHLSCAGGINLYCWKYSSIDGCLYGRGVSVISLGSPVHCSAHIAAPELPNPHLSSKRTEIQRLIWNSYKEKSGFTKYDISNKIDSDIFRFYIWVFLYYLKYVSRSAASSTVNNATTKKLLLDSNCKKNQISLRLGKRQFIRNFWVTTAPGLVQKVGNHPNLSCWAMNSIIKAFLLPHQGRPHQNIFTNGG